MEDESNADTIQAKNLASFLNLEYQETHKYFLQIESTMHDVLKFYSVSLLGLISVSVALAQFLLGDGAEVPLHATLTALWSVFTVVGFLQLHYYLELRIRKIKMVEQLAAIRDSYLGSSPNLRGLIRLIPSVRKSPPFLRRPSAEWYSVLYFCAANAGVGVFAFFSANREWDFLPDGLGPGQTTRSLIFSAIGLALFLYQFYSATALAHVEDLKRESEVGPSQYDLFAHDSVPHLFWPLNWIARVIEAYTRHKRTRGRSNG